MEELSGGSAQVNRQDERAVFRLGAVSSVLGLVLIFVAEAFHGGHQPADLQATLPAYAANPYWETLHVGQFLGYSLLLGGLVALHRSLVVGRGAAVAHLGLVVVVVAGGIYGANQGVDAVANKFVAEEWVSAPPAEKADAFRVANAVRHVEIGLTGLTQVTFGIALLLYGLAIALGNAYPRVLGWAAMVVGAIYVSLGLLVVHAGFAFVGLTMAAGALLALWFLVLAINLWRKAG
jgi:hypothetical protein